MADPTEAPHDRLDLGQIGVGDMDAAAFRTHGYAVIEWIASYLERVGDEPVLSAVSPGEIQRQLPVNAPTDPEPFERLLSDVDDIILPGITHWNHPAFHAYFAITGSGPGILAEAIIAALNVNGMLWRTSPSATELEHVVVAWLRDLMGLPGTFDGIITDSASISTLLALAAAREATDLDIRQRGLTGRADVPLLRIYTSEQAHSSVEKAAITLGLGRDSVRFIPTDAEFRMDVDALQEAIQEDARFGYRPLAVVPTVGTTSTTSVDPVAAIADVRDAFVDELGHTIWLHVDGAYGGLAAISEDFRWVLEGVDRADSFVTNPHKWLFTPIDASVLLVRDPATLTRAFSLVPEYLATDDQGVSDYMDWGVQLGRRFRALKLWFVIRYFGASGLRSRIQTHVNQAQALATWIDDNPDVALVAPVTFSTVCFRASGVWSTALPGFDATTVDIPDASSSDADALLRAAAEDYLNRELLHRVNASGQLYLSHTVLGDRYVLRFAIGNLRTTHERLRASWQVITDTLEQLKASAGKRSD